MKIPYWDDPNQSIKILEPTQEAMDKYGRLYGSEVVALKQEHIDALLNGKVIAFNDGEYSTFLISLTFHANERILSD